MALSKLAKRRLTKLVEYMASLPRSADPHFRMRYWFSHSGDHAHKIGKFITAEALEHCGTTACALGWAATVPTFKKAGFRIPAKEEGPEPLYAARKFFNITNDQAEDLFIPSGFFKDRPMANVKTPRQWASKARRMLKKWEAA